jgi:hypothetical protein
MKDLFLDKFKNTVKDLLSNINELFPDNDNIVEKQLFENNDYQNILRKYYENSKKVGIELSEKNEIVFSSDVLLLDGINFYEIWNSEIGDESKESIWKYLHTMYLYADQYNRDVCLPDVMKLYKKASKKESLQVDRETRILFGILDNICGNKLGVTSSTQELETRCSDDPIDEKSDNGSSKSSGLPFSTEGLFSGQIGQLATEIAGELDVSKLETENPNEMIQNLLSGNMNEDSPVLKLVHQISDKIQNKLSSGEVNEMDLFKEAQGTMKMMGGKNKQSPFNMLHKMTEGLNGNNTDSNESPDDIAKQMEAMLKSSGINTDHLHNAVNNNGSSVDTTPEKETTNERQKILKDRLKKKKQQLETRKQLDKERNRN